MLDELVNEADREELARLIKEGYTNGRLDSQTDDGKQKYIAWELELNAWTDEEE